MPPPPSPPTIASSMAVASGTHNGNTRHSNSALAWTPATTATPRRTTVALDGATRAASLVTTAADAVGVAIYDKQLLWKQHGQKKVDHLTLERLSHEDHECTFAPKINRSSSDTRKAAVYTAVLSSSSVAIASADVVRAFTGAASPQSLGGCDGGRSDCSSSQYSASLLRSIDSADLRRDQALNQDECPDNDDDDGTPLHPTESQESSILLHLARQERARDDAQRAQHRLSSTQPRKDFTRVTAAQPFELSVTNRKPRRSTSASPTRRAARPRARTGIAATSIASAKATHAASNHNSNGGSSNAIGPPQPLVKRRSHGAQDDAGGGAFANGAPNLPAESDTDATLNLTDARTVQWQQERDTLLTIIDTQRRELERRERAQDEAARLAETFAAAVEGFAQRLEVVERTTSSELSEMKQLLARQAAATDLLLHALGLSSSNSVSASAAPPLVVVSPPLPPSPSSSSSSSTAALRRETK